MARAGPSGRAGPPGRAGPASPSCCLRSLSARAPDPRPAGPWLLQPPHRRGLLPVAQHRPHPRPERAGQAGRTLQAGGGRTGRAPGPGPHRGLSGLGANPAYSLEVVDVRGCRPAPPSQLSQGRRRGGGRRGARLALLALAAGRRVGDPQPDPPSSRCRRRPGWPPSTGSPPTAPGPGWARPTGPTGSRTGGCTRAGWSASPPAARMRTRTVAVLTSELLAGDQPGRIGVRTGTWPPATGSRGSWSGPAAAGFDHRPPPSSRAPPARAAASSAPYEADGSVGFRDHTDEARQFAYTLPGTVHAGQPRPRALDEDVELVLELTPRGQGRYRLRLQASDRARDVPLAAARLDGWTGPPRAAGSCWSRPRPTPRAGPATGSPASAPPGPRWPGGRSGPRARSSAPSTLLNGPVLKLTAQLLPVGDGDPGEVRLQLRRPGGGWDGVAARVGPGSRPPSG